MWFFMPRKMKRGTEITYQTIVMGADDGCPTTLLFVVASHQLCAFGETGVREKSAGTSLWGEVEITLVGHLEMGVISMR